MCAEFYLIILSIGWVNAMWPKGTHNFSTICQTKKVIEKNEFFNSVFSYGMLRDSSLTHKTRIIPSGVKLLKLLTIKWKTSRAQCFKIFSGFCSFVSTKWWKHWPNAWKVIFLLLLHWNDLDKVITLITWHIAISGF